MSKESKYDVIIVGGGPSGLSCGKILADNGVKTLLIQRSTHGTSQSFYSGLVYEDSLKGIFGKFWEGKPQAPFERFLSKQKSYILDKDSFTSTDTDLKNGNNFIINKNNFNSWMIKQLDKAGVDILDETVVRNLILEGEKVIGVKTDSLEFYAENTIISEGVKSILCKKAGLRKGELTPDELYLFVEEVLELPSKTIEERFELETGQGISGKFFPKEFFSLESIGYFHTSKKSITIGVGVSFSDLIKTGININFCIEGVKIHPLFKDLIRGAQTIKYSSYILPKKTWAPNSNPRNLNGSGYMIIGGASQMIDINSQDISYLPLLTSKLAAEAIISKNPSSYQRSLIKTIKELTDRAVTSNVSTENLSKTTAMGDS